LTGKNIVGIVANGNTITVAVDFSDQGGNANRGIFRSTDGGNSFAQVGAGAGLPTGSAFDLVQVPSDPNTLYTSLSGGSTNGIYKSINGGANWTKVSDAAIDALLGNSTNNVEFATGIFGNVYVGILNNSSVVGLFRSGDSGATWTAMDLPGTTEGGSFQGLTGFNLHFSITADPNDQNVVYVGGGSNAAGNSIGSQGFSGRLFRGNATSAAGSQWVHLTDSNSQGPAGGGTANRTAPHADSRDLAFDANGDLIEGDDGGVFRRTSPRDNTGDWFSANGNLSTIEAHDVAYDSVSNTVITANQDNGTTIQTASGSQLWRVFTGGDGGDILVDDVSLAGSNQSIRYSSFQNLGAFRRSTWDAAGNFVSVAFPALTLQGGGGNLVPFFITPTALNAIDPQRIVIQGQNGVYESLNQGDTISNVSGNAGVGSILQDAIAYGGRRNNADNAEVLWVGSGSNVYFRSAAGNLAAVTSDPTTQTVRDLTIDVDDWATAFIIDQDQVFQTTNMGAAWMDVTGNLMSFANELYSITYFASATVDALLVGTDRGVFAASTTDFTTWVRIGDEALPNVIVDELDWDAADDLLVAGTMGRGAWMLTGLTAELVNLVGPARLNVTITPDAIAENGGLATGTVSRNGSLANPLVVDLISSDPGEASVPAQVTILAGEATATFTITGVDDATADGTQIVTITAQSAGFADGMGDIGVIDNETANLTLVITPSTIPENGGTAIATLTRRSGPLNSLELYGDLIVTLSSSDTTELGLPSSVTIADGQSSLSFAVFAIDDLIPDGTQTVTVTATAGGYANGIETVDVTDDEALTLTISPLQISENGGVATGTVTRHVGTVGDLVVQLSSSDTTEATVPATVVIRNGQTSATFQIT
ncbi:MAG: hypothetical protein KDA75_17415, partial [Planctomycetaceae bacterium]|nr:hypothetical protein [Planctomycetaceae bacterium]